MKIKKIISINDGIEQVYVSAENVLFKTDNEWLKFMNNFKLIIESLHPEKIILMVEDNK